MIRIFFVKNFFLQKINSIDVNNIFIIELYPNNSKLIEIKTKKIKQVIILILKKYKKTIFEA
jgi:hypothetical protein